MGAISIITPLDRKIHPWDKHYILTKRKEFIKKFKKEAYTELSET